MRASDRQALPRVNARGAGRSGLWRFMTSHFCHGLGGHTLSIAHQARQLTGSRSRWRDRAETDFPKLGSMLLGCQRLSDVSDDESCFVFLARPNCSGRAIFGNRFAQKSDNKGFHLLGHSTLHCLRCGFHRTSGCPTRGLPLALDTTNFPKLQARSSSREHLTGRP